MERTTGEAKKRGTFEERKAAACGQTDVFAMIEAGEAPHFCFILDRSPVGQNMLRQMRRASDEILERANSGGVKLWEETPQFGFVVIWGSWGYSGGLTVHAADLQELLDGALPAVIERTLDKGGFCTFIPAVDDAFNEPIMQRLAQLQPAAGQAN